MNTQRLTSTYYDLTHGWRGFVILYLLIAVFSIVGLKQGRASLRQYLFSPITSLLTLVAVGLSMELLGWILGKLDVHLVGIFRDLVSVILIMMGGFLGGVYWAARGQPLKAMHGRGAVVFDGAEAQRHARCLCSDAVLFARNHRSVSTSLHHVTESAVLASEIEQLPDLQGFLKFASSPQWRRVKLTISA